MFRWYLFPIADSYLVVLAAAVVLLALLWTGPARNKLGPRRRLAVSGIRLAIILLVIAAMLRPTLVHTTTKKQSAALAILADRTRSMSVRDEVNGRTRWEAEKSALEKCAAELRKLSDAVEVKPYAFDSVAHPVEIKQGEIKLGEEPDGQQTAIGSVLEDVLREQEGKRVLGVIMLSDWAQRAYPPRDILPQTAAGRMKRVGCPLYAVRFGQPLEAGKSQDVAVTELEVPSHVFVKNELGVTGQIRIDGYMSHPVRVRLFVEDSAGKAGLVAQQSILAAKDSELTTVHFSYVPQQPGEYKLTVEAEPQPGELVLTNNRVSTFVNVLKGGLSVLYLEGTLRPEISKLRRSLDASPDMKVDYYFIDPRNIEKTRPPNMPEMFKPGKYDVYILGDLDSSVFEKSELTHLAESVKKGAGLIMLGGFHSFGPGGYAETPLAEVLPVEMHRLDRQLLNGDPRKDVQIDGPTKMVPTQLARGPDGFAMRIGATPQKTPALWEQLPPLDGANILEYKLGAKVLAETPNKNPLLISQSYGDGRVMAFAGDSTGRWWMHGYEAAHKRFWRQAVLWLAKKDESTEGNVWIKIAQRRFAPGQPVDFTMGALAASGDAIKNAAYHAEIEMPGGGRRAVTPVRGPEQTSATFRDTQKPGDYTIHLAAEENGRQIGSTRARFLVFEQDLELDNATADATVPESLASMTGGKTLAPEELPALVHKLAQDTAALDIEIEAKVTPWDTWPFFLVMIGLMGVEWWLRKKWGLV